MSLSSGSVDVVLVTVTYNAEEDLPNFLECYSKLEHKNTRLIVIDNASSDDSVKIISESYETRNDIELIKNIDNLGVAAANNQGIKRALTCGANWVVLINNDVEFPPDLIDKLVSDSAEDIVTPLIPYHNEPDVIWFATGKFSFLRGLTGVHNFKNLPVSAISGQQLYYSTYAPTCCMAITSSVFEQVGLMDEDYFVYFDDTDFCWRLKEAGYRIKMNQSAQLLHKVGSSTGGIHSEFTVKFTSRNRVLFLRKNKGRLYATLFLPVFWAYYFLNYSVLRWAPKLFAVAIRGTVTGFFMKYRKA